MSNSGGETFVETVRVSLQCPISHAFEEGIIMEIVQFLLDAKREKHALWSHFHSAPWPPGFFTAYPENHGNAPLARQGLVVFTIDCRSLDHAKSLLKTLRASLRQIYSDAGRSEVDLSVFIHKGERQNWSASSEATGSRLSLHS